MVKGYESRGAQLLQRVCAESALRDEMRGWIEDCFEDVDANKLTRDELHAAIERHYDGGIAQFKLDA